MIAKNEVNYFFDEYFCFNDVVHMRGFAYSLSGREINISLLFNGKEVLCDEEGSVNLASPDIADVYGSEYRNVRFHIVKRFTDMKSSRDIQRLVVRLRFGNDFLDIENPATLKLQLDPMWEFGLSFFNSINKSEHPKVLELGSRSRSGISRRNMIPGAIYTGLDIYAGPNVDVVGDAHELSEIFSPGTFDFVFSISVFEHLIMPWKAALEINKILKIGGVAYIEAPQTWPEHDSPWDYFRFSENSWCALFNKYTGFEIVKVAQGIPANVVPYLYQPNQELDHQPGWMLSGVIARKISDSHLSWSVPASDISQGIYPIGEIEA